MVLSQRTVLYHKLSQISWLKQSWKSKCVFNIIPQYSTYITLKLQHFWVTYPHMQQNKCLFLFKAIDCYLNEPRLCITGCMLQRQCFYLQWQSTMLFTLTKKFCYINHYFLEITWILSVVSSYLCWLYLFKQEFVFNRVSYVLKTSIFFWGNRSLV